MRELRAIVTLLAGAALAACAYGAARSAAGRAGPTYDVYAVRFATLAGFPASGLVAGADSARTLDIAMMVWLLEGSDGRRVMVDAGFHRDKFVRRWRPVDYVRPSEAVARAGVRPEDVTDVVVSHVHWDHLDGADLFPRARVWLQRAEYDHYVDSAGRARDRAIDVEDAAMLDRLRRDGRLMLIDGDAREILPGITVYTGGRHTHASQFVGVRSPAGIVVVASDNAYLYENLERGVPIAQTLDSASNRRAQARMRAIASSPRLIVPGHDAQVFARFPRPGNGVAKIE